MTSGQAEENKNELRKSGHRTKCCDMIIGLLLLISASTGILVLLINFREVIGILLKPTVVLTVLLAYFAYSRSWWSNPRTSLEDFDLKDSESFGITLKNVGADRAVFRVRVWINGENRLRSQNINLDFANSLFAQIPVQGAGRTVYPKRTRIAKGDFRQFRNDSPTNNRKIRFENLDFEFSCRKFEILTLPTQKGSHEIVFRVQQTGETWVFNYIAGSDGIEPDSIKRVRKYGGRHILGRLTKYIHYRHYIKTLNYVDA